MTFPYQSQMALGKVVLNVKNLQEMTNFYTDSIGFKLIKQTKEISQLGLDGNSKIVLELQKTKKDFQDSYGLFHTAILVPDRNSLALALHHLITIGAQLEGASDHGYSEAIYLSDPEGNGIEIYRDKEEKFWDIRDDGQIIGVTEPMDAQGMLNQIEHIPDDFMLNSQTIIGHVHLSVKDALESSTLYQKVFNMKNKMTIPSASWIASGQYHHHLAFNHWAGPKLSQRLEGQPGLNYLTIEYTDAMTFKATLRKAQLYGMTILLQEDKQFLLEDSNGIRIHVLLIENI